MKRIITMLLVLTSLNLFADSSSKEIIEKNEDIFNYLTTGSVKYQGWISAVLNDGQTGLRGFATPYNFRGKKKRIMVDTNGNNHIVGDYLLPIRADVVFEAKDENGDYLSFESETGDEFIFEPFLKEFYIIETAKDYKRRIQAVKDHNQTSRRKIPEDTGPFVGIGKFQYNKIITIEFYEISKDKESGEAILKEAGLFNKVVI